MTGSMLLTPDQAVAMVRDTRDTTWQQTRLGRAVVDYLAWAALDGNAARTLDQKERDLAVLCRHYGDRAIDEVTSEDCMDTLTRGFPPGSHRRARSHLKMFFSWAVQWRHRDDNPVDRLPRPRARTQTHIDTFSDSEASALIYGQTLPRDRVLAALLIETGIRKEEATHLRVRDLDLEHRRLTVRRGKGGKSRVVPIPSYVCALVADLLILDGLRDDDHLWYGIRANQHGDRVMRRDPIVPSAFHRWWGRMIDQAGVGYRKPHTCRHTYATRWLRDGGSIHALSRALGHASIRTTIDEYAHLGTDDISAELERVLAARAEREG